MAKKVQAIIIKNNKILSVEGMNRAGRIDRFFICEEVKENEKEITAIKRGLEEQLAFEGAITFEFQEEIGKNIKTFFIDLQKEEIDLEKSLEKINYCRENFKPVDLKWVELNDVWNFREIEAQYIRLLLKEAIKKEYQAPWMEVISNTHFNSKRGKKHLKNLYIENGRNQVDGKETINSKILVMLMALGLGILFNHFFMQDSIGISGFFYSMTILIASICGIHNHVQLKKSLSFVFLIPIILLSLSFGIYNNPTLRSLNVLLMPFLITSYLLTIRYEKIKKIDLHFITNVLERIFSKTFNVLPKFFIFSKEIKRDRKKLEENTTRKNIIRGLIISIPLLIIIVTLLTSADMMFKYYVENIGNLFGEFSVASIMNQIFLVGIITVYMFGFLWSFKYNEITNENQEASFIKASWEPITMITIIFVINIAYLLFTIVQFSYLYIGGIQALPEGFSYAEYARKGFFELILVTLINFGILLLSINLTKKENDKVNRIANLSYSLLIAFTFNMLISASYKMYLYESAYGFTRLRIFVQVFMILIGILLVIVLLGIWVPKIPIFKYAVIATLVVYVGLNFINVDQVIAKENIIRYEETGAIDMDYMKKLSYDAAPELRKLLEIGDIDIKTEIRAHLEDQKEALNKHYNRWYEFNYYKRRLLKS